MPNPNTIVDLVQRLDPPLTHVQRTKPSAVAVHLRGGGTANLDMRQAKAVVFAELLEEVRLSNQPVYLEVDPTTGQIQELLLPTILVPSIIPATAGGDRHEVEFIPSQARHFLRPTNPNYRQMLAALTQAHQNRAPVLVTETWREHEIIDVRPLPAGVSRPPWIAAVSAGPGGAAGTPGPAAQPL